MSQENVEFVKGLVAAGPEMDKQASLAALPELIAQTCDPEIEWYEDPQRADARVYRGHSGVLESWERWLDQWDEYGTEAERFVDCGDDVLVVAREHARGARSGATVSARIFIVITFRDGKVFRYREFYDEAAALQAAGLSEQAMPEEHVEVVRAYFSARSEKGREGVFEFLSPDVVWKSRTDLPDTQTYTGHDGVRALFSRFRDVMDDMWFEPDNLILAGDRVVAPLRWGGRGKGSGVIFEEREAWVFTVGDGVIARVENYGTWEAALEAVGLSEQDISA